MARNQVTEKRAGTLTIFIICLAFFSSTIMAIAAQIGPFNFGGSGNLDWNHHMGNEKTEETVTKEESYGAGFNQTISMASSPTQLMDLNASMRYSRPFFTTPVTQTLQPTANLNLDNDIFNLNFNILDTESNNSDSFDTSSRVWAVSLRSNWKNKNFPTLTLRQEERKSLTYSDPEQITDSSSRTDAVLHWGFRNFRYYFSGTRTILNLSDQENLAASQNMKYQFSKGKSFWNNKISTSFSQGLEFRHNFRSATADTSGQVVFENSLLQAKSGVVEPDSPWSSPLFLNNSGLQDGNTEIAALQLDPIAVPTDPKRMNIAMQMNFLQVDIIHLYTTSQLTLAEQNLFQWDVYVSDDGNQGTWTLKHKAIEYHYNSTQRRFEIETPALQNYYVKLVAVQTPSGNSVSFSEIKTYRRITTTRNETVSFTDQSSSSRSSVDLGYRISEKLNLSSSALYYLENFSERPGTRTIRLGNGLTWLAHRFANISLNASETRRALESRSNTISRDYSSSIISAFLPTLRHQLIFSRSESLSISQDISKPSPNQGQTQIDNTLSSFTSAQLYPDLAASLKASYDVEEASYSVDSSFNARIIPKLHTTLSLKHTTEVALEANLSLTWRPTDIVSLNSNFQYFSQTSDAPRTTKVGMSISPTGNTRLSASYTYSAAKDLASHAGDAELIWFLGDHLTWQSKANYTITDGAHLWFIDTRVTAAISF